MNIILASSVNDILNKIVTLYCTLFLLHHGTFDVHQIAEFVPYGPQFGNVLLPIGFSEYGHHLVYVVLRHGAHVSVERERLVEPGGRAPPHVAVRVAQVDDELTQGLAADAASDLN